MELELEIEATPAEMRKAFSRPRKTDRFSIRHYERIGANRYACVVRLPRSLPANIQQLRDFADLICASHVAADAAI